MFPGNDIVSSLIAVQMGGTGGGGKAKAKTITENGAYAITDEEKAEGYVGYSPVIVNVPPQKANIIPLTISQAGTYNAVDYSCDGFNPVVSTSSGSGGGSGGNFYYEDDDIIVSVFDKYNAELKYYPSIENEYYISRFNLWVYIIYKYAGEVKRTTFGNYVATVGSGGFTASDEAPVGAYKILSISAWEISDINIKKITDESDSQRFKIEVSITCEASGVAEYIGSFTYKNTSTVTNSDWLFDENA